MSDRVVPFRDPTQPDPDDPHRPSGVTVRYVLRPPAPKRPVMPLTAAALDAALRPLTRHHDAKVARLRRRAPQLVVPPDLALACATLIELLADVRGAFDRYDPSGTLRQQFEVFRAALERAGLPVRFDRRRDRAMAHRRLGELAEQRGDLAGAWLHYDLAVKAWRDVGCRQRRDRLSR